MPFPSETYLTQIQGVVMHVADEFIALYSQLTAWLSIQHKDDGSHSAVTADSVEVSGVVDITGDLTVGGTIDSGADVEINSNLLNRGAGIRLDDWIIHTDTTFGDPEILRISYVPDTGDLRAWEFRRTADGEYVIIPAALTGGNAGTWIGDPLNLSGATTRRFAGAAADGFYDRGRTVACGDWTDVAFDAANFTASGTMTWTVASGDQNTYSYILIGNTMTLTFKVSTTSVTAPLSTQLRLAIPGGRTVAIGYTASTAMAYNQGTWVQGWAEVASGEAYVRLYTTGFGSANWAASVDLTYLQGQVTFEVAP